MIFDESQDTGRIGLEEVVNGIIVSAIPACEPRFGVFVRGVLYHIVEAEVHYSL